MSWYLTRRADESVEIVHDEDGKTTIYEGEASEEWMRLFKMLFGTDDVNEIEELLNKHEL